MEKDILGLCMRYSESCKLCPRSRKCEQEIEEEKVMRMNFNCTVCLEKKAKQEFYKIYSEQKKTGLCKKCKSTKDKEYRKNNKEKISKYFYDKWRNDEKRRLDNKNYKSKSRNGVPYSFILDKKCEVCGITNDEHLIKYGNCLNIHHIDNTGRHNNRLGLKVDSTNIQVLCQSCHTKYGKREGKLNANC